MIKALSYSTYQRVLLFLIGRLELGDNLTLREVVIVHALVVSIILSFLEPHINGSKRPWCLACCRNIASHKSYLVFSIDQIELAWKVNSAPKVSLFFVPLGLCIDLKLFALPRIYLFESKVDLLRLSNSFVLVVSQINTGCEVQVFVICALAQIWDWLGEACLLQLFWCSFLVTNLIRKVFHLLFGRYADTIFWKKCEACFQVDFHLVCPMLQSLGNRDCDLTIGTFNLCLLSLCRFLCLERDKFGSDLIVFLQIDWFPNHINKVYIDNTCFTKGLRGSSSDLNIRQVVVLCHLSDGSQGNRRLIDIPTQSCFVSKVVSECNTVCNLFNFSGSITLVLVELHDAFKGSIRQIYLTRLFWVHSGEKASTFRHSIWNKLFKSFLELCTSIFFYLWSAHHGGNHLSHLQKRWVKVLSLDAFADVSFWIRRSDNLFQSPLFGVEVW